MPIVPQLSTVPNVAASKAGLNKSEAGLAAMQAELERLNRSLIFGEDDAAKADRARRVRDMAEGKPVAPARSISSQLADGKAELADRTEALAFQVGQHKKLCDSESLKLR